MKDDVLVCVSRRRSLSSAAAEVHTHGLNDGSSMRIEAPASKWATHDYRELAAADHSSSHINHMSRRFVHHCLYHRRKIGGKYWGTSAEFDKILLGVKSMRPEGRKPGGTEVPSGIYRQSLTRVSVDQVPHKLKYFNICKTLFV